MPCCGFLGGSWSKSNATKGLVFWLSLCFLVSLIQIFASAWGLVGNHAMGVGQCNKPKPPPKEALGKWDDGSEGMHLNWYVCETNATKPGRIGWSAWTNGNWYKPFCGWHRYTVAAEKCREEGAYLVSIQDQAENDMVQALCGYETCWIGLREQPHTEEWIWEDGRSMGQKSSWLTYTNWNDGEPNNNPVSGEDETVAFMNLWQRLDMPHPSLDAGDCPEYALPRPVPTGTGRWYDISAAWRVDHTICERPFTHNDFCNEQNGWIKHSDSCYHKHCASLTLQEAVDYCASNGAALVSINSLDENRFVRTLCGMDTCRIGLQRDASGKWSWVDGTDIGEKFQWTGYVNWDNGEPNNWEDKENAAVMNMNALVPQIKRGMLFRRLTITAAFWGACIAIPPAVFILASLLASRCHSAFCASVIRTATGIYSSFMVLQIIILCMVIPRVDGSWPEGSKILLASLCVCGAAQMMCYCCANQKAQELQWACSAGFSTVNARSIEPGVSMQGLNPEAA